MAEIIITEESNYALWTVLNEMYISEGQPRDVTLGSDIYHCIRTTEDSVEFHQVTVLDYIDSRSLSNSRSASYKNLDG